jgi:phospholipid/cholesterol/gamma-HCH transport system permease protein
LFSELDEALRGRGGRLELVGMREELTGSLERFQALSRDAAVPARRGGMLQRIGHGTHVFLHDVRDLVGFVGLFVTGFAQAFRRPGSIRWRDFWLSC